MDATAYGDYLERLIASLGTDERVIGVIGLGSTASTVRDPDEWSDHDLWVVVEPGSEEGFRADPSWLPDYGRLILWLRETEHGVKAVYDSGHLVEVAVLRPDELPVTRANDYRVLLDKGGVAAAMTRVRTRTVERLAEEQHSESYLAGQVVTGLLVGLGRYARGEEISAHEFIKMHTVIHLLTLMARVLEPSDTGALDDLNPWRRVEQAFPGRAARISIALASDLPSAALGLLAVAETLKPMLDDWPSGVAAVVRRLATDLEAR
jgi:hypothetical protein